MWPVKAAKGKRSGSVVQNTDFRSVRAEPRGTVSLVSTALQVLADFVAEVVAASREP